MPAIADAYINPDVIAREINPDDPVGARIEAGREAIRRIDALLDRGDSFAVESTLSGKAHVKMIERAKSGAAILRRLPNGAQVCYNARVWKRY